MMPWKGCILLVTLLFCLGVVSARSFALPYDPKAILALAASQLQREIAANKNNTYPTCTSPSGNNDGMMTWTNTGASSWTSGFYPGLLWAMYNYSRYDPSLFKNKLVANFDWKTAAQNSTKGITSQENNTGTHDVGFMVFYSFGHGYEITKDPDYLKVILKTAESLATRFNPVVGCIRSWPGYHFPVIVDNMLNLELLFWAAEAGGNKTFYDMAVSHADKTRINHIRKAGNTWHLVDYDPDTGAILSVCNCPQGLDQVNATWGRGQAWAVYGFTIAYRYTKLSRFLDTAILTADWWLDNIPADYVPYWDFAAPHNQARDTSAAAVVASALVELAGYVGGTKGAAYLKAGLATIASLAGPDYIASPAKTEGILLHGTGTWPNSCVDVSIIYGDYYFIEAVLKTVWGA